MREGLRQNRTEREKEMTSFNVKIQEDVRDQLKQVADSQERTLAAEVRIAIREHLDKVQGKITAK